MGSIDVMYAMNSGFTAPYFRYFQHAHFIPIVVVVVVVSYIQRIGCQPEKLLYAVANPARGLLSKEK